MPTPTPLPRPRLEELLRSIEEAPKDRSALIDAAAGGDPILATAVERWLAIREADLHDQGTIAEAESTEAAATNDLDATLAPEDEDEIDDAGPPPSPQEAATLVEDPDAGPAGEEMTLLEDEVEGLDSEAGSKPAPTNRGSNPGGGGGTSFSSRPDSIEGFQVEKLLGAGGMGSVYLCRQSVPEREVAVKLMLPGLATPRAVQRFEFEIETLAKLSHPNVAKLFEAGMHETPEGPTPYVAMEMVRGARTIIEYADDEGMGREDRIRLFVRACRGVAFGHGRGVIHRDLKPPNLLVDERGEPKVIDFGVALAADDEVGQRELVGTLQYMAPEQASRGEVGTATDVYAMGMILFELLAGEPPYVVPGASLSAALEKITTVEVPRLSTRIENLHRDVDAIVFKSLSADPEERYATAGDFAADLQRYLNDEPTIARAPTFGESILRIIRKHRIETGFAAAALVALVVGLVGMAIFAYQAEGARAVAELAEGQTRLALERVEDEQTRMERSLLLFVGVLSDLKPTDIGETMMKEMVDSLDREFTRRGTDEDVVVDAILRQRELAEVFGPTDVAVEIIEKHLEEPTLRMLPLIEDDPRTLANINEFLGEVLVGIGRLKDAEKYYQAAVENWSGIEPRSGFNRRRATGNLADTILQRGRNLEAMALLESLVADGRNPAGALDLDGLRHLNALATARAGRQDYDGALAAFEEVLDGYLELPSDPASLFDPAVEIVQVRLNLSSAHLALGDVEKAEPMLMAAEASLRDLDDMEESQVQVRLSLGRLAFKRGEFEAALKQFEQGVKISSDAFGRGASLTAKAMYELGSTRFQTGDHAGAIPMLQNAREVQIKQIGRQANDSLLAGLFLTLSHAASGNLSLAEMMLEEVDGDFAAARAADDADRLTLLYFFAQYANAVGTLDGERAATNALERLFDGCLESTDDPPKQMCLDAAKLLPRFYEAMIEAEPEGDWAGRQSERFGS